MTTRTALVVALLGASLAGRAEAQSGGAYSLAWSTMDGGGQTSATGGAYRIGSTVGQPDASRIIGGLYTLSGGFWAATGQATVDAPVTEPIPLAFAARTAQPNPFRSTTTLAFDLPAARSVELVVHGIDGRVVRRLAQGEYDAGRHRAIWDGRDGRGHRVASGIYFARLVAGEFTSTQRIVRLD